MGSWDQSCAISGMPIRPGDDAVCILLLPSAHKNHPGQGTNITDDFVPISYPIVGMYDDYGDMDGLVYSESILHVISSLKLFIEADDKYTPYSIDSFSDFMEKVWMDSMYAKINQMKMLDGHLVNTDTYCNIRCMFVHKGLFDILNNEISNRKPFGEDKTFGELINQNISKAMERVLNDDFIFGTKINDVYPMTNCIGTNIYNITGSLVKEGKIDLDTAIKDMTGLHIFDEVLTLMRKGYFNISGLGSQCQERYLHYLMAEWIMSECEKTIEEAEEYEEKDEGYDENDALKESMFIYKL